MFSLRPFSVPVNVRMYKIIIIIIIKEKLNAIFRQVDDVSEAALNTSDYKKFYKKS